MAFLRYYKNPASEGTLVFAIANGAPWRSVVARGMDDKDQTPVPVAVTVSTLTDGRKQGTMAIRAKYTYELVFKDAAISEGDLTGPLDPVGQDMKTDSALTFAPSDAFDRDPPPPPPLINAHFQVGDIVNF